MSYSSSITNLSSSCVSFIKSGFCLPLGIHNFAIAFQFRCFFNEQWFFLPFGIHNFTIGLTLFGRFTYQRSFLFFLVCITTLLSLWLPSDDLLMITFISSSEDDSSLSSSLFPLQSNE